MKSLRFGPCTIERSKAFQPLSKWCESLECGGSPVIAEPIEDLPSVLPVRIELLLQDVSAGQGHFPCRRRWKIFPNGDGCDNFCLSFFYKTSVIPSDQDGLALTQAEAQLIMVILPELVSSPIWLELPPNLCRSIFLLKA